MSIGPTNPIAAGAAGSPLAQTQGADKERTEQSTGVQQRQQDAELKAERAAGIGETDGNDHETHDRDADGRRVWEISHGKQHPDEGGDSEAQEAPRAKDTTGQRGNLLDLTG
jgi:hypothetical protein